MKSNFYAGQFNLKGKKSRRLGCGCCRVFDLRDKIIDHFMIKEIEEEIRETSNVNIEGVD
jgi:hypothetical protein